MKDADYCLAADLTRLRDAMSILRNIVFLDAKDQKKLQAACKLLYVLTSRLEKRVDKAMEDGE